MRSISSDLALETTPTGEQFMWSNVSRAGSRAGDDVRETVSEPEQQLVFPRIENAACEPTRLQRGPEPVAGPREVMANGGRVQAWVYAAENDLES